MSPPKKDSLTRFAISRESHRINSKPGSEQTNHTLSTIAFPPTCWRRNDIRTAQELLGYQGVKTTKIYIHVLNRVPKSVCNPMDHEIYLPRVIMGACQPCSPTHTRKPKLC